MLSKELRVSFCQLHCFSVFSGRCGKFVSSLLILSLFITCFTFSSSAASNNLLNPNMTTSEWKWDSFYNMGTPTISYTVANGNIFSFSNVNSGNLWCMREVSLSDFNPDHNYNLSFSCYGSFNKTNCRVWVFYDNDTTPAYPGNDGAYPLVNITFSNDSQWHNANIKFKPSQMYSGAFQSFIIAFEFTTDSSTNINSSIRIKDLTLIDQDDDSGILDSILDWLSRIYHSIVGGTDTEGVNHTGLVQGIANALTVVKTAITDKLEAVKTAIKNAIDNIQGWLVSLGEDIIDGLKALFIPSEEFLDDFKSDLDTWCTAHFGALYQAPYLAIDFIRELLSISNGNGIITLPDIRVEFFGHTYTILESQTYDFNWVNNTNHVLHTFYTTYRAFTFIILILGLIHYLRNKYYQIFASMNDFAGGDD